MRTLVSLALVLSGCQLLPIKDVNCSDTDRCASFVSTPFVLGQPDTQTNWLQNGISRGVGGVLIVNGQLLVSDTNNNRILVWKNFPTRNNQAADQWLGQPNLSVVSNQNADAYQVSYPTRLSSNGSQLVVATDTNNTLSNKPLIFWNSFPGGSSVPYDFQISPGPTPVAGPLSFDGASPFLYGTQLFLSDRTFNRVLVWTPAPSNATTEAGGVIGQADVMTSVNNGPPASSLKGPEGSPASDGNNLYVSDTQNNRVLVYALPLTATPVLPMRVLGQASLTATAANRGGGPGSANLGTMNGPTGLSIASGRLAVADRTNNRVLLWKTMPTQSGQNADLVLGQPNLSGTSGNNGGVSAASLSQPTAVAISPDGNQLAIADTNNSRVLLWNNWPTTSGTPADLVLGQATMTTNGFNGTYPSGQRFLRPMSVTNADSRLIVADADGNRVLIWSQFPFDGSAQPTIVLGQASLATSSGNSGGISAVSLSNPSSVSSDGTILAVADSGNNRVLLWNRIPTEPRQAADVFVGQPSATVNTQNSGGAKSGISGPYGVFVGGGRLYVADTGNSRVLIWKTIPTQNQAPDLVLGQGDFTSTTYNRGTMKIDATTLNQPRGVYADEGHIYISDTGNNRVLIWNTLDPTSAQAADVVLGAQDFISYGRFYGLLGLQTARGRLYVTDSGSNRILYWNSIPTQSLPPSGAIGQPNLNSGAPNPDGIGPGGLQTPGGFLVTDVGIYIADGGNGRVLALPPLH